MRWRAVGGGGDPDPGTAYHPTALATVGLYALPVPGLVPGSTSVSPGVCPAGVGECVFVCVCEREGARESEREREIVCVKERKCECETEKVGERERVCV